ncbi:hypothetical protein HYALB_00012119 [Hymenoscyphus albidus]|uniref:Nonribosomal peptide synthetase 12 n=1 Tax=Hymenoscyphus albidus TaxID=595503 RepID=A0A9N9PZR2_9HELO|nr:hypothetical protein HYALB_00012119 [Hymenoscyphus albidus]
MYSNLQSQTSSPSEFTRMSVNQATAPHPAIDLLHRIFEDPTLTIDQKKQLLEEIIKITRPEKTHSQFNIKEVEYSNSESSCNTSLKKVDYSLPEKNGIHGLRSIRHRIFSLYRRLFTLVIIVNLATLIGIMGSSRMRRLEYVATAVASNLTASVLFRQEHVVNLLFWIACSVPVSAPLWIRRNCAKVYHIGGLHSGFAVASLTWLLVFTVLATIQRASPAVLTLTYILDSVLVTICALAHPIFRVKYHDHFELTHRFAGWTALALFWAQTIVQVADTQKSTDRSLGYLLLRTPNVWLLAVATGSTILPWAKLRKVTVKSEVLSSHAVRLHFDYTTPFPGTAVRISSRPLLEWHAFATISKPASPTPPAVPNEFTSTDGKGFSLVVSNAGDWTKRQITHPPTKLYARGIPTCAVLCIVPLFHSILLVATGSGIGPCLPILYRCAITRKLPPTSKRRHIPLRVFWSTPNPLQTFGQEIHDAILDADPQAVIHDTRTMGRPDMLAVSWGMRVESGCEAVCVISNKKVTQKVVYGMEARGVPGFGAIFDS